MIREWHTFVLRKIEPNTLRYGRILDKVFGSVKQTEGNNSFIFSSKIIIAWDFMLILKTIFTIGPRPQCIFSGHQIFIFSNIHMFHYSNSNNFYFFWKLLAVAFLHSVKIFIYISQFYNRPFICGFFLSNFYNILFR